jgi:ubiquinone/menaquinone biosynthesis C-methylase UbiE
MSSHDELRNKALATYNAAADRYDDADNTFWDLFGRRTIARLGLRSGMHVLDVCAGSGASAIPAAEAVGPTGRVVAVDISSGLLRLLTRKAEARGLRHVEARIQDLLALDSGGETFDAVVCVFGIFFLADMATGVRRLWQCVRPGGRLAITTWGPHAFEPGNTVFWTAVRRERPDLYREFAPWDIITEPEALRGLLSDGGVPDPEIETEEATHPLASPDAWWSLVMGSGYRGTIDQLTDDARARVREDNLRYVASEGITAIEANVIYAIARKSAQSSSIAP